MEAQQSLHVVHFFWYMVVPLMFLLCFFWHDMVLNSWIVLFVKRRVQIWRSVLCVHLLLCPHLSTSKPKLISTCMSMSTSMSISPSMYRNTTLQMYRQSHQAHRVYARKVVLAYIFIATQVTQIIDVKPAEFLRRSPPSLRLSDDAFLYIMFSGIPTQLSIRGAW